MDKNSAVLVTGGTGSFGKAAIRSLLTYGIREIRVFSRDEEKQDAMRSEFSDERLKYYIGDVRDYASISSATHGVDYVFHAAALKQVPSCEFFPMQAVLTNIQGSDNVIRASIESNVKNIVCLSTDKAVYPINAMGMTKAMMEKVAQAYARRLNDSQTNISCVRYGNVMFSRGSVIPRFIEQIRNNQQITVTEPSMTRFLLALSESVELVNYAFSHANQGDIFIKKAPACTVDDLASALKNIFNTNVETKVIGFRHGEKLYETLATKEELVFAEDMGDFYRLRMDGRDLNYDKYFTEGCKKESFIEDYHSHNTRQLNVKQVEELLMTLPEVRAALDA